MTQAWAVAEGYCGRSEETEQSSLPFPVANASMLTDRRDMQACYNPCKLFFFPDFYALVQHFRVI